MPWGLPLVGRWRHPLQGLDQQGYRFEQVRLEAVVGNAEDRRLGVLVDRDDHLRILHARQVLDRAADAGGDVQLGRDDLAGLADLPVVRGVARVDRGAACTERGAELVRERGEYLVELVARAERTPTGDDDLRRGEFGPIVLRDLAADEVGVGRCRY